MSERQTVQEITINEKAVIDENTSFDVIDLIYTLYGNLYWYYSSGEGQDESI